MAAFMRRETSVLFDALYWIGIAMTLACFALILGGNTELLWRFEHAGLPLSWAAGAIAVLSFLAAELCPLRPESSVDAEELYAAPELEAGEF